jgi:DNA-directed RNA polymerase specialized sigma24 family protein
MILDKSVGAGGESLPGVDLIVSGKTDDGWNALCTYYLPYVVQCVLLLRACEPGCSPEQTAFVIFSKVFIAHRVKSAVLCRFTDETFRKYLFVIVKHYKIDIIQDEKRGAKMLDTDPENLEREAAEQDRESAINAEHPMASTSPYWAADRALHFKRSCAVSLDAMKGLSPKRRRLLELNVQGESQARMAKAVNVNVKAIGQELKRAQQDMSRVCSEKYGPVADNLF